ncbi:ferrochelatase [Acetobacter oeni]|uniref:Ferrochelatase n=1 Tax=Acetobacter oeni TaxID=304077 RepID=A0A511XIW6_9PROT|nr:ferrochelatase [Acetobacter oeni]MBB3882631.1 ferrochelatase [Acetobacter oeni]NHO18735.1 ferrochelatase [Acetobacter oeni]GBR06638.1 ferrochelatase [Acetobacter oeni LMG 21952]GEN62887.1 ferrochelatase [Acetobacter oeni]
MSFLHISGASEPAPMGQGRVGILLANLGTPDDTGFSGVRRYLSEFLSDQRVIEASPAVWQPILQGVVLTVRPRKSGAAYRRIWNTDRNESPLRTWTREQSDQLAKRFSAENISVVWGMRYGKPSVAQAVGELMTAGCDRILFMPLYPQYSATTTATANDQLFRFLMKLRRQPAVRTLPAFADHPAYIRALAETARQALSSLSAPPQMIVTSFHGLPNEYVAKGDPYRQDCERTVAALRTAMGMTEQDMPLTFQSRFGPAKWLEPYTAPFIAGLPEKGVKRIAVIMPGFMADCIETLDEIGNEVRSEFLAAGGEELTLIPCLNGSREAIDLLETLARSEIQGWAA